MPWCSVRFPSRVTGSIQVHSCTLVKVVCGYGHYKMRYVPHQMINHNFTKNVYGRHAVFFRAQEPKAPVTYCDHALSGVRRPSVVRKTIYIFNFFSRTAWWILMKLGMDEVLKVPYKCCCFSARSVQGRIQGGAKIGHGGSPSSGNFFFRPEGYSNKPNA